MSPLEARNILGLKPEDDPQSYLADFADARERIAEMVRKAPNETLASRFQEGLVEFDRALAVMRTEMDAKQAAATVATPPPLPAAVQTFAVVPEAPPAPPAEPKPDSPSDPEPVVVPAVLPPPLPPSAVVAAGVFTAAAGELAAEAITEEEKPAVEIPSAPEVVAAPSVPTAAGGTLAEQAPSFTAPVSAAPVVETPAAVVESVAPAILPPPLPASAFAAATTPAVAEEVPAPPAAEEIPPVVEAVVSTTEPASALPESESQVAPIVLPPPLPAAVAVAAMETPATPVQGPSPDLSAPVEAALVTGSQKLSPVVAPSLEPEAASLIEATTEPVVASEPASPVSEMPAAEAAPVISSATVIPVVPESPVAAPSSPSPLSFVVPVHFAAPAKAPEETAKPAEPEPVAESPAPVSAAAILPPPLPPSSFLAATIPPVAEENPAATEPQPEIAAATASPVAEQGPPVMASASDIPEKSGEAISPVDPVAPAELPAWLSALRVPPAAVPEPPALAESVIPAAALPEPAPVVQKARLLPFETPLLARRTEAPSEPTATPESEAPKSETPATPAAEHTPELATTGSQALPRFLEPLRAEAEATAAAHAAAEAQAAAEEEEFEDKPRSSKGLVVTLVVLLALAGVGGLGWKWYTDNQALTRQARLTFLETLGAKMIEARQWPEAANAYDEIESLKGDRQIVERGRQNIDAGKEDEQNQFVGYWAGEALAAFEAGRSEDAEEAARKVLERYPNETETAALLTKIEQAKITKIVESLKKTIRDSMQRHQWDAAEASAKELTSRFPDEAEGYSLLSEIREDRDRENRNRTRAADLFSAAKLKDQGRFDREAMEWLREAQSLDPEDKGIAALYEKMASYTRTVHVPGDFADLKKALESCGDRDRIVLGEGTWPGGLVIGKGVSLEGAGPDKTIIEVDAKESAAVTFGPGAKGARISGIAFRQTSFDNGANRFPALLVRGGELAASDCRFENASGHGAAVIDAGSLTAKRCTFANNGWDGAAAQGNGSHLALEECESNANYGHGYDLWNGASGSLHGCQASQNSRNGILVDTTAKDVLVEENELRGNREYGIVISAAASGKVRANACRENLLGGLVMRAAAGQLAVENNRAEKNSGPGLVLEQGLVPAKYTSNAATANGGGKDTVANVDFSAAQ